MALTKAKLIADNAVKAVHIDETDTGITLAQLNVTGNITATNVSGNVTGNVTGDLTGTILTAAQPNITSVGTLSSLAINGGLQINGSSNISTLLTDSDNSLIALVASSALVDNKPRVQIIGSSFASDPNTIQYLANTHAFFGSSASLGEKMRIDSAGNVGIGTTSIGANSALLISKNNGYLSVNSNIGVGGATNPSYDNGIHFGFNRSNGFAEANIVWGSPSGFSGHLEIGSWSGTAYTERMRITSGGNVGIGTTAPGAKLTVVGGIQSAATASGTPDALGLPGEGETRYYYFPTSTSFQNFLTVPGTNATFLMVYRIGQSDLTSVPNGMVMIHSSPGVGYTVISGSSSYLNVSGSTIQIRSNWGSYGTGVWMMLTRIA